MEIKSKSIDDVWRQMNRCRDNYHTFDNTQPPTPWLKKASEIANYYMNSIARHIALEHLEDDPNNRKFKFSHAVRSYMPDTPLDVIRELKPWTQDGLYFIYNGEKVAPRSIYFGCDTRLFREDGTPCGRAYCHYDNALRAVFLPDGKRYMVRSLSNVNCSYKDGLLYDFYRE